jgi:periplasmic protein TonB
MTALAQSPEQNDRLDRETPREPIGKPMIFAFILHGAMIGAVAAYALIQGFVPHYLGGGGANGDAIAVNLVSNALPLPANEKPNDNVLATDRPSDVPAPPAPKAQAQVDQDAIPIPTKIEAPKKADKKQVDNKPVKPVPVQPTTVKPSPHATPNTKPDNRVQVGEQSSTQIQRATTTTSTTVGTVTASSGGVKGFPYPYYLQNLERKMQQNVYMNEVDARTPKGTQANIIFTIRRDGTPIDAKLDRSSGSPTLDRACLRGVQRIDNFGPLPSPPGEGNLFVSHHCDY